MKAQTEQRAVFSNLAALQALCHASNPVTLHYTLGVGQDRHLNQLVELCSRAQVVLGVVFIIENSQAEPGDVFYLRECTEKLLLAGKRVGLWGVSEGFQKRLLGGYLYMRYHFDAIHPDGVESSMFRHKPLDDQDTEPFNSQDELLQEKHGAYLSHCRRIESPTTRRRVYYVTNIDYHSENSYQDRFIYQCDYLSPMEYRLEKEFLLGHALNHACAERLASLLDIDRTSQIAYSLAQKEGRYRESFYIFVPLAYGEKLLLDLDIGYEIPQLPDMRFMGAGVDVTDGELSSYKLYFLSPTRFILGYFEPHGIDVSGLSRSFHHLVLRLDDQQQLQSYKIELQFTFEDLPVVQPLLEDYTYFQAHLEPGQAYNMAVEFERGSISKVNVYHRDALPE